MEGQQKIDSTDLDKKEATDDSVAMSIKCSSCGRSAEYKVSPNYCALCGSKLANSPSFQIKPNLAKHTEFINPSVTLNDSNEEVVKQFWDERSNLISRYQHHK